MRQICAWNVGASLFRCPASNVGGVSSPRFVVQGARTVFQDATGGQAFGGSPRRSITTAHALTLRAALLPPTAPASAATKTLRMHAPPPSLTKTCILERILPTSLAPRDRPAGRSLLGQSRVASLAASPLALHSIHDAAKRHPSSSLDNRRIVEDPRSRSQRDLATVSTVVLLVVPRSSSRTMLIICGFASRCSECAPVAVRSRSTPRPLLCTRRPPLPYERRDERAVIFE